MKLYTNQTFGFFLGISFMIGTIFAGCGSQNKKVRTARGGMDTQEYHVSRGDDAMEKGDYQSARTSYQNALNLNESYALALVGKAVADVYVTDRSGVSSESKQQVLKEAEDAITKALDSVDSEDEKTLARIHSSAIQVYYVLQIPTGGWYDKVQEHYEKAVELTPNDPTPYYFMAQAEFKNLNYEKAIRLFRRVLDFAGKYELEADKELERIQKVQRALPGSRFGKSVADIKEITRADVAALFIAELRLDKLYEDRETVSSDAAYEVPAAQKKMETDSIQRFPEAIDIEGHPMESTIKEVIRLKIRGLEPNPAHKFFPEQKITRAEFAMTIQDILIKITRDKGLATQYIGQPSPFPDVNENVWYYNSARTVVDRGFMPVNNVVTGEFEPMASVSGAEALLAIRTMKEILKKYLR